MKVSVVVPTFNRSKMLRETIESILNQTIKDIEIIVIDNCSVDDTKSVLDNINDKRIRYFKHSNNGIIAINMNYGMKQAKGDFIAFCDDDDLWVPSKLEKQLSEFEKDEKVALVCCNGINFNKDGDIGPIYKNISDKHFTFDVIVFENRIINSSILVKKSVIDEVGMMDDEPEFLGSEEYSLWIRIAKKYKIKYIDEPLVKYRTHGNVYRTTGKDSLLVLEKIYNKLLKNNIIDQNIFNRANEKINYERLLIKLINKENINLDLIQKTKISFIEKTRIILFYFISKIGIFNILRQAKNSL